MCSITRDLGTALVMITQDPKLAARADRMLTMSQGELSENLVAS